MHVCVCNGGRGEGVDSVELLLLSGVEKRLCVCGGERCVRVEMPAFAEAVNGKD